MKKDIWFGAKEYGYGWYPLTWQAWIIMLCWLMVFVFALEYAVNNHLILGVLIILFSLILLIWICWKKGEKARWRWGSKR
jgi:isoprenylcysteine carboxyl methyltransferase (ICMT) family protein YpbQ